MKEDPTLVIGEFSPKKSLRETQVCNYYNIQILLVCGSSHGALLKVIY